MKQHSEWRQIQVIGLSKYKINTVGSVKVIATERYITEGVDRTGSRAVLLYRDNKKEEFKINHLVFETFGVTSNENFIVSSVERSEQFSNNEDNYGKGTNQKHWQELKEQIKTVKLQEEKLNFNEQDNSTDHFPEV